MRFSSRFFLYGPFALLVALAASVMIYWWVAATALSARLDALNGHEIAQGVRMHFGAKRIAGFPFRLDTIFKDFALTVEGTNGPVVWRTDGFATHTLTYDRDVTILEAAGRQRLSWRNDRGVDRRAVFVPGLLRASAVTNNGKLQRFDVDAISAASPKFAAGRVQLHLRPDPVSDALDLVLDIQELRLAGDTAQGFPHGLSRVRIDGRLAPGAPFASLLAGRADWLHAIERWRSEQGFFKVDQAAVFWGKCEATSSGTVALDPAHRLRGSLALSLANCSVLRKDAASIAAQSSVRRPVLSVLAELAAHELPDKNGALPATIVFKDGIAFVGPGKSIATGNYFEPVAFLHAWY